MNKFFFYFFCFFSISLFGSDYSIAFVHIGKKLPDYLEIALGQARLFNKNCPIFLIANTDALQCKSPLIDQHNITYIPIESLKRSNDHLLFLMASKLDHNWRDGFWNHTTERFFYLSEAIEHLDLKNVFHLENDNMLYVDLETLLPIFKRKYPGMGIILFDDNHCVPSFMYISNKQPLQKLCTEIIPSARKKLDDMSSLGVFKKSNPKEVVDCLPIIMDEYPRNYPVHSKNPALFSTNLELFQSIFDGASIGQYLGGCDPFHGPESLRSGMINPYCVFDPSFLQFEWQLDEERRNVPYMTYQGKTYRINNLHIHCKDLNKFKS
jgi:hypothetical protein